MESNGIRILEPFDTSINYSKASGKTNIHLSVSDIFMNFSFSILRLFLAVEEDILAFLRTTSRKMTIVCSQFDKIGTIKGMPIYFSLSSCKKVPTATLEYRGFIGLVLVFQIPVVTKYMPFGDLVRLLVLQSSVTI